MKTENTFDIDKFIRLSICIQNASMIAAMCVTLQERLTKLAILLKEISYVVNLKEAIQYLNNKAGFLNLTIPLLAMPAANSMEAVNAGNRLFGEALVIQDGDIKLKNYINNVSVANYKRLLLMVSVITGMESTNDVLNATLITIRAELDRSQSDEQKKKAALAINLIAQTKLEINHLQEAFNEMLSCYYY